ncbi:hypothetical protein AJ79_02851 [Helicocarpus griseus UAMH5409]|uniref:Aminoglycoside phosphotransferase domain-containing protein n=1 Tax=Helicocarpus griseus UAMH5409 TaxID=1447875 RepID=A0A2B7Y0G8_9EURO|nr:hypothetical protein AJ79_02851 [Helicocarpus griseus UAMH5409]
MKELHWSNYTPERMQGVIKGFDETQKALVLHCDTHPRNMMVLDRDPARAIWIDFDRAQTFSGELTQRHKDGLILRSVLLLRWLNAWGTLELG